MTIAITMKVIPWTSNGRIIDAKICQNVGEIAKRLCFAMF